MTKKTRVLVAMSGGVDSSVTAGILKNQGYEVIGVHMQLWDHGAANAERFGSRCCSIVDSNDARRVCDRLDVPFYVLNAQEAFKEKVVDYFVHEYLQNRTPNPCVECNTKIKFGYLFQKAEEMGCDYVATGHYAQVAHKSEENAKLLKAVDPQKDQSYFLFGLTQKALKKTLMPLGGLQKQMVRKLAVELELPVAEKPDSQEICFIGQEGYQGFIEKSVSQELRPGGIVKTLDGSSVGEHEGLHRYTIGQRKGLKLTATNAESPQNLLYVVGFDSPNRTLLVGTEKHLMKTHILAKNMNWIQSIPELGVMRCKAKIRSQHEEAECEVTAFENHTVRVHFADAQRAVTPGQAIVFYQGDEVLGGGFIEQAT